MFSCSKMYFYSILENCTSVLNHLALFTFSHPYCRYSYTPKGSFPARPSDLAQALPRLNPGVVPDVAPHGLAGGHFPEHSGNSSSSTSCFPLPPGNFSPSRTNHLFLVPFQRPGMLPLTISSAPSAVGGYTPPYPSGCPQPAKDPTTSFSH